ncbi:hypothetical protein KY312_02060 [Candidatus Woesearchaeota archaeon]|nr:hypothetical protein [Candidatus Woesearchaeota archaeon]
MEQEKKPISEIEKDAKLLDLVLIELPAEVHTCYPYHGMDFASGFYLGVENKQVILSRTQKRAYDIDVVGYPVEDIKSYEILRRFKPNPNDGIDYLLTDILGITSSESDGDEENGR